jgi:2-phosphoglycolate phosphatase
MSLKCLLLDLDGTLVDTAPDMARTLNELRAEHGLPPLSLPTVRAHVSHGVRMLIRLAFGLTEEDPRFANLRERYLEIYRDGLTRESRLFPGMEDLLQACESRSIKWGIVTNKTAALTHPLLAALGVEHRAACIICGDTMSRSKPHPDPLLEASRRTEVVPGDCLYVGDAQRDIEAGRRAGMKTLIARFGYIGQSEQLDEWQADGIVNHPLDILGWLLEPTLPSDRAA